MVFVKISPNGCHDKGIIFKEKRGFSKDPSRLLALGPALGCLFCTMDQDEHNVPGEIKIVENKAIVPRFSFETKKSNTSADVLKFKIYNKHVYVLNSTKAGARGRGR